MAAWQIHHLDDPSGMASNACHLHDAALMPTVWLESDEHLPRFCSLNYARSHKESSVKTVVLREGQELGIEQKKTLRFTLSLKFLLNISASPAHLGTGRPGQAGSRGWSLPFGELLVGEE